VSKPAEDPFPRRLIDSEIDDIFHTRVRPILTGPSRDTPTTVLLGGGQGSGKTTALSHVASHLGLPHAFLFEGDDFYDYHPSYADLRRQAGGDVAQAMRQCLKDVEALRTRTLDYLLDNRMDLIRVGPMTGVDYVRESVMIHREHPTSRRIEVAYMAVHPAITRLSVLSRHHNALQPGGAGYALLPPPQFHDIGVTGPPQILGELEGSRAVEALHVVTREGVSFSKHRGDGGAWHPSTKIQEAYLRIRDATWTPETVGYFVMRSAELRAAQRPEWGDRLERAIADAAPAVRAAEKAHGSLWPLMTDRLLAVREAELASAIQRAEVQIQALASSADSAAVPRELEGRAPEDVVARARASAREDQMHARHRGVELQSQTVRLRAGLEAAAAEKARRDRLPPHLRTAEVAVREQLRVASPAQIQSQAQGPRVIPPTIKRSGQGQSL
jgi:hypothetical protein